MNKLKLIVGVIILAWMSAVIAANRSPYIQKMPNRQWAEIILIQRYRLDAEYADILSKVIETASEQESVPVETIISVMAVESKFDPKAVSPCGAIGLMQVKPETWDGKQPYNIHDKYENVFAGAWVLHNYKNELQSDRQAIMAYNIGITHFRQGKAMGSAKIYYDNVSKERRAIITNYPKFISTL